MGNKHFFEGTQKTFAECNLRVKGRGERREGSKGRKNDHIYLKAIRVGVLKKARNMMSIL